VTCSCSTKGRESLVLETEAEAEGEAEGEAEKEVAGAEVMKGK